MTRCIDDDGAETLAHDWSEWVDRPDDLPARHWNAPQRLRWCVRCNTYESDPPRLPASAEVSRHAMGADQ